METLFFFAARCPLLTNMRLTPLSFSFLVAGLLPCRTNGVNLGSHNIVASVAQNPLI